MADTVAAQLPPPPAPLPASKYWLGGVPAGDARPAAQLNLPDKQGLLVEAVTPEGPAAKTGIRQHDVSDEHRRQADHRPGRFDS